MLSRAHLFLLCLDESRKKRKEINKKQIRIRVRITKAKLVLSLAFVVRTKGLEPPRLSTLDPKSSAATNYATSAFASAKIVFYFYIANL